VKVILVSLCEKPKRSRIETRLGFSIENLGLGFLASSCERSNVEVAVVDAYALQLSPPETVRMILSKVEDDDDIIGVSILQSTVLVARLVISAVRSAGFSGRIVLGGWALNLAPRDVMGAIHGATYGLIGESEAALPLLAQTGREDSVDHIPGIMYRRGDGWTTSPRNRIRKLSDLPPPIHYLGEDTDLPLGVQRSRGCSYGRCTFCSTSALYGRKERRVRESAQVLREVERELSKGCVPEVGENLLTSSGNSFIMLLPTQPGQVG